MTRSKLKAVFLFVLIFAALSACAQTARDIDKRVESILSQLTLEEKIDYIAGFDDFYIRSIPRLGVPELKMADGPLGVRNYGFSTAFPAGIAMAASWDTALVNRIGTMMGKDARARGVNFLLGPGMNIYRAPMGGRNFEYFGEDPFLASRMAVADIKGIQSQGVIATAKHFMGNNQEWDRHRISSDMDERTMREIYLPAFEASVREAHVGAIMDSYNLLNGVHMSQNGYLNTDILRKEWGFTGIVMSDWDATYDAVAAANGGLDLEMPWGKQFNREKLIPTIQEGKVSQSVIDEKVRRILRTAIEFGFFDRKQTDASVSIYNQEARQVALDAALGGTVLLKNNGILPLSKSAIKSIAVIGPNANPAVTGGGGSSKVMPFVSVSFLEGISDYLGTSANVLYSSGVPVISQIYNETRFATRLDGLEPGLRGEYFDNSDLTGTPTLVRTARHISYHWGQGGYSGTGAANFSARWTGYYTPAETGEYRFYLSSDDVYRLYVDQKLLIEHNAGDAPRLTSMTMEAGKTYGIRLEYTRRANNAGLSFGIAPVADRAIAQAKEIASRADVVVLCVGFDQTNESEGGDRTFTLPAGQDELIQQVLSVNKNAIVVLTAGGNADMSKWLDSASALVHTWYPGQEGGTALAKILFGDVNPSGKLPVSFERRLEDSATYNSYYDPKLGTIVQSGDKRDYSGAARGHVAYSEGIFLGYRHFDKSGIKPLFPFGYGLSYTTFKYANLKVTPKTAQDGKITVSFDITNTGKREGAEISQVYVGDKHSKVERPVKELKGFAKVNLKPGETRNVTVELDRRAFSYYDVAGKQWKAEPGDFDILVGSSSAKIELTGKAALTR